MRILPSSFFILSHRNRTIGDSSDDCPSQLKVSWPRGLFKPKVEFGDRGFLSSSRLAGPWYNNTQEGEKRDLEAEGTNMGDKEREDKPRRSYTLQRSEGYDIDRKQVLVEKVDEEVGERREDVEEAKPRRSYTLQRSEGYDIDKKQVLVEKVEKVDEEVGDGEGEGKV